jgi:hypothetical protein
MAHYKRKIATVCSTYGEVMRHEHEQKVNERICEIRNAGNTIVSIMVNKVGINPIQLIYDIVYEEGRPSDREHCRFMKSVLLTVNEVQPESYGGEGISEKKVCDEADRLCEKGAKIITYIVHNIGLNPIIIMYDIIYEAEQRID